MNFYKKSFLAVTIFSLMGCVCRNNFGRIRPNKINFSNKKCIDEKVFDKIDTSAIYLVNLKWFDSGKPHINGYKFYSNNRLAFFIDLDLNNVSGLDPKNANMGYYTTCDDKNKIKTAYYTIQGGVHISKREFEIKKDSLIVTTQKSPQGGYSVQKYFKKKLLKNELIFSPDW
ncbi:MAG: hypothetical protein HRT69_17020 [Flavobacteriaceae bacterium]|nr:hypothetical protein [Flavobacteriaceae bacterium]